MLSHRSPTVIIAGAIVAGLAILGIIISAGLVMSDNEQTSPQPPPQSTPAEPSPEASPSSDLDSSDCGLTETGPDKPLTRAPAGSDWMMVGRGTGARVEGHGPGETEPGGYVSCYARTPTGALLAAANFEMLLTDPNHVERAASELVAEGAGREALMEAAPELKTTLETAIMEGNEFSGEWAGFIMHSYDGERAQVTLLVDDDGVYYARPVEMRWENGDWRAVRTQTGEPIGETHEVSDASQYVDWSM